MAPTRLKRHYGGSVTGDRFWPRPDLSDPIVSSLLAGESIKLFGLRRTGKSSIMREVERALRERGRNPVYIDVQGQDRIDGLMSALVQALPQSATLDKVTGALSSSRLQKGVDFARDLMGRAESQPPSPAATIHRIEVAKGDLTKLLAAQNGSLILIIDELPFLIDNMIERGVSVADVNVFLAMLRAWRQDGGVPMLLAGSVGLAWLIRERGIGREHFNGLVKIVTPPPLVDEEARAMLAALALEEECAWMTADIMTVILEESGVAYPSFLQFAFGRLKDHKATTAPKVRRVFKDHIHPSLHEDFYAQFDTRMNRFAPADKTAMRAVLRVVDQAGDVPATLTEVDRVLASQPPQDRDDLLSMLVEDGFIAVDTRAQTVTFGSPLVQTWWQSKPYRR
jgi:hypothetical protein